MELKSTKNYSQDKIKFLVYGDSGVGKTRMIATLPKPLIISTENKTLSIKDYDIPLYVPTNLAEFEEACGLALASDGETIVFDSLSDITDMILEDEKSKSKDARQAYLKAQEYVLKLIRYFRNIDKHVYFIAKAHRDKDESNKVLYMPSLAGQKLSGLLPYYFDEVFYAFATLDEKNEILRGLITSNTGYCIANDSSGKLDLLEQMDLGYIINKINN